MDNERISQLLEFIRYDYPRAASVLKYAIGRPQADSTFEELLVYLPDDTKEGFSMETFLAINELHDIHKELMRG